VTEHRPSDPAGAGSPPDDDPAVAAGADGPGSSAPPPPPPPVDLSHHDGGGDAPSAPPLPPAPPVEAVDVGAAPPKRSWTPVVLVLLLVSVGVGAYFGFRGDDDETAATTDTTAAAGADEFVAVHDAEAGFTVSHPKSWGEISPADGEQRLLLSAGGQNYFQVKVRPIDPATVDQQIAEALAGVKMVTEPREVTLNGIRTYYFLYFTPVTEKSPLEGVHAHYFMLNGDTLYTMVFQALPSAEFTKLAPTFDKVAESFQVDDPAATTATTGATSTTAP